jgi:hypothetical protein
MKCSLSLFGSPKRSPIERTLISVWESGLTACLFNIGHHHIRIRRNHGLRLVDGLLTALPMASGSTLSVDGVCE